MKAFELGFTKLNYFFRLCWWAATTPSSPAGPSRCGSGSWPVGNTTPSTGPSCRRTWWTTETEEGSDSWTTKIQMTSCSYHAGNSLTYGSIKLSDNHQDWRCFLFEWGWGANCLGLLIFSLKAALDHSADIVAYSLLLFPSNCRQQWEPVVQ